jgi:hypothetical protein
VEKVSYCRSFELKEGRRKKRCRGASRTRTRETLRRRQRFELDRTRGRSVKEQRTHVGIIDSCGLDRSEATNAKQSRRRRKTASARIDLERIRVASRSLVDIESSLEGQS